MTDKDSESPEESTIYPPLGERSRPLILIADDDPNILHILDAFFEDKDCDVIQSINGADALEQIIVHKPDLIILDVMMPELNGWQICKYVKSREEYARIAIIMLTAIGPVNNELTSPIFGADDYIDKPFQFEELKFKISKVLSEKHELNDIFESSEQDE